MAMIGRGIRIQPMAAHASPGFLAGTNLGGDFIRRLIVPAQVMCESSLCCPLISTSVPLHGYQVFMTTHHGEIHQPSNRVDTAHSITMSASGNTSR